jgi:hypothetical protein
MYHLVQGHASDNDRTCFRECRHSIIQLSVHEPRGHCLVACTGRPADCGLCAGITQEDLTTSRHELASKDGRQRSEKHTNNALIMALSVCDCLLRVSAIAECGHKLLHAPTFIGIVLLHMEQVKGALLARVGTTDGAEVAPKDQSIHLEWPCQGGSQSQGHPRRQDGQALACR